MYSQIAANKRKTALLMLIFIALVSGLGWVFSQSMGDQFITYYVIIGAFIYVTFSYFTASRTALAINGAKEIHKRDNPRLYRIVENLAITDGLPMPKVYIMNDPAPNAFATGRDPKHASCSHDRLLEI
jgi:heat shock protein HtpX